IADAHGAADERVLRPILEDDRNGTRTLHHRARRHHEGVRSSRVQKRAAGTLSFHRVHLTLLDVPERPVAAHRARWSAFGPGGHIGERPGKTLRSTPTAQGHSRW